MVRLKGSPDRDEITVEVIMNFYESLPVFRTFLKFKKYLRFHI